MSLIKKIAKTLAFLTKIGYNINVNLSKTERVGTNPTL